MATTRSYPFPVSASQARKGYPTKATQVVSLTGTIIPNKLRKIPMFIKLRKKIINWLRASDNFRYDAAGRLQQFGASANQIQEWPEPKRRSGGGTQIATLPGATNLESRGTRFTLYAAAGGIVIELFTYDPRSDETITKMHVIPEDEDLPAALSKIITLEALRNS